jgi:TPR repeat protein
VLRGYAAPVSLEPKKTAGRTALEQWNFSRWQEAAMDTSTMRQLRIAAEGGEAAAQFNLAVVCDNRFDDNGYPIEGNRSEAMKWLLAAAEQGLPRAQGKLAEMYAADAAGPDDYVNACAWFLIATRLSRGIHRHQARSGYALVSARLTAAQRAKARRFASNWQPKTASS